MQECDGVCITHCMGGYVCEQWARKVVVHYITDYTNTTLTTSAASSAVRLDAVRTSAGFV